jgi:hypothetical protein
MCRNDLLALHKLAREAETTVQFGATTMYRWRVPSLTTMLQNVRLVRIVKETAYSGNVSHNDLRDEILATVCAAKAPITKAKTLQLPQSCGAMWLQIEFFGSAVAHVHLANAAFGERHELHFFADNARAMIDVITGNIIFKSNTGAELGNGILPKREAQVQEILDFTRCVEDRTSPPVGETQMLNFTEVLETLTKQ